MEKISRRSFVASSLLISGLYMTRSKFFGKSHDIQDEFIGATYSGNYHSIKASANSTDSKGIIFKYNISEDAYTKIFCPIAAHSVQPFNKNKKLAIAAEKNGRKFAVIDWTSQKIIFEYKCEKEYLFCGHCAFSQDDHIALIPAFNVVDRSGIIYFFDTQKSIITNKVRLDSFLCHDIVPINNEEFVIASNLQSHFACGNIIRLNGEVVHVNQLRDINSRLHHLKSLNGKVWGIGNEERGEDYFQGFVFNFENSQLNRMHINGDNWAKGELLSCDIDNNNRMWVTAPAENKVFVIDLLKKVVEKVIDVPEAKSLLITKDKKMVIVGSDDHFQFFGSSDQPNAYNLIKSSQRIETFGNPSAHTRLI
jgi:hypothetical protein